MSTPDRPPDPVETAHSPTEEENVTIARDRVRKLSGSSQGRICARCHSPSLVRFRRPLYLRLLRRAGLDLRTYQCGMCGTKTTLRHRK